jgi:hypothetical protein
MNALSSDMQQLMASYLQVESMMGYAMTCRAHYENLTIKQSGQMLVKKLIFRDLDLSFTHEEIKAIDYYSAIELYNSTLRIWKP